MAELSPNVATDYPITQYRLVSTEVDQDGEVITTTKLVRSVQGMLSVTPRESVSTVDALVATTLQPPFAQVTVTKGTWTKVSTVPISDLLCMEVTESRRITTGPAVVSPSYVQTPVVREDKWDDENGVLVSTFWQYVTNTYAQEHLVGDVYTNATYTGGSVYAYNSISSFGILDAGTGYTSIPTLAVAAPTTGGTNATGTVTSLKLTDYTVTSYGSGYSLGDVATLVGGSGTAATLTVSGMGLTSASLLALGSGYIIGDQITLSGGINTAPAIVSVASYGVSAITITAAGTSIVAGATYSIDTGGTYTIPLEITVLFTKAVSIAYVSGGFAADGSYLCKGTTGNGTLVKVTVTVSGGGTIFAVALTSGGKYFTNPTNISLEPLTTDTGATMTTYPIISMVMGINSTAQPSIAVKGSYSVQASSLTNINGIALTPTWGISTVTVDNAGSYTTSLPTTLYQLSTTGVGIGATFQTFTWTPNALTISSGGAYTAIANGNCATTGGGTGLTLVPSFGIGAVSVGNAGTGYRTAYPTVTLSYGNAKLSANPDTKAIYTASAAAVPVPYSAYVISSQIINTEHALIKKSVWVAMPVPFPLKTYPATGYNFPAIFSPSNILLDRNGVGTTVPPPTVGYDYLIIPARSALFPARTTRSFSVGPQSMPTVFSLYSYQSQTKYYPQLANCSHSQFNVRIWRTDVNGARTGSAADDVLYEERVPPSSPIYSIGTVLTIQVSQKRFRGNIWEMEVTEVSEYPLL
jgi:hypothetical protein